jgi:hypothetical protein
LEAQDEYWMESNPQLQTGSGFLKCGLLSRRNLAFKAPAFSDRSRSSYLSFIQWSSKLNSKALLVSAFCHFYRLAFGRFKSWVSLKFEKTKARIEILLASGFWQHPIFELLENQLEKVMKK